MLDVLAENTYEWAKLVWPHNTMGGVIERTAGELWEGVAVLRNGRTE
jgi:hypothetical protein